MDINLSPTEISALLSIIKNTNGSDVLLADLKDKLLNTDTITFPTGIQDIDFYILNKWDDTELFRVCSANKYTAKLCNTESFWLNRISVVYSANISGYKPKDMSYKQVYRTLANKENNPLYVAIDLGLLPIVQSLWHDRENIMKNHLAYLKKIFARPNMMHQMKVTDYIDSQNKYALEQSVVNAIYNDYLDVIKYILPEKKKRGGDDNSSDSSDSDDDSGNSDDSSGSNDGGSSSSDEEAITSDTIEIHLPQYITDILLSIISLKKLLQQEQWDMFLYIYNITSQPYISNEVADTLVNSVIAANNDIPKIMQIIKLFYPKNLKVKGMEKILSKSTNKELISGIMITYPKIVEEVMSSGSIKNSIVLNILVETNLDDIHYIVNKYPQYQQEILKIYYKYMKSINPEWKFSDDDILKAIENGYNEFSIGYIYYKGNISKEVKREYKKYLAQLKQKRLKERDEHLTRLYEEITGNKGDNITSEEKKATIKLHRTRMTTEPEYNVQYRKKRRDQIRLERGAPGKVKNRSKRSDSSASE